MSSEEREKLLAESAKALEEAHEHLCLVIKEVKATNIFNAVKDLNAASRSLEKSRNRLDNTHGS